MEHEELKTNGFPTQVIENSKQLKKWISADFKRFAPFSDCVEQDYSGNQPKFRLYTNTNKYTLSVAMDYLGCVVVSRKARAGEQWHRGRDLHDGAFNKDTWDKIKNDIISLELNTLSKNTELGISPSLV